LSEGGGSVLLEESFRERERSHKKKSDLPMERIKKTPGERQMGFAFGR